VAKTAVAPLDRLKILFQTHHSEYVQFSGSWRGALSALAHIVKTQGILGLYRGHSLTLARAIPHAAIGYTVYELVRPILMPTKEDETSLRRMLAGSIAGVSVLPVTYPFELVRVRMAIETKKSKVPPKVFSAFKAIYQEPPVKNVPFAFLHFYPGFAVTFLGTVPYRGGIFLVWETLNAAAQDWFSPQYMAANRYWIHFVVGAIAGTSSQIATYPLEVIRRTQQANLRASKGSFMGFRETIDNVWRTGGWRGFYAGLGIGLVKQVPMHAISLATWQASKKILGV